MNEMNSIGNSSDLADPADCPGGMNSEKKCRPCFQKPTPRTMAKLISDMTPVNVNWLVTVNGCARETIPKGMLPIRLANSRKMNAVNTHGKYFLPSGPMLAWTMSSTKPISPSTVTCQRPGNQLALHSAEHEHVDRAEHDQHPQRAVGEDEWIAVLERTEDRLDHELVHRVDFGSGRHASLIPTSHASGACRTGCLQSGRRSRRRPQNPRTASPTSATASSRAIVEHAADNEPAPGAPTRWLSTGWPAR